jgi:hypothetical protein
MERLIFTKRRGMSRTDALVAFVIGVLLFLCIFFPASVVQAQTSSSCCTPEEWELIGITAEQIGYAFGWGFGAVVLCWFFGFGIGVAVNAIRRL